MSEEKSKIVTPLEDLGERIINVARAILYHTPQLYRITDKAESVTPEPWASSVLIKVDNAHFVITAGHVFKENGNRINPTEIGIMVGDIFHILKGDLKFVDPDAGTGHNSIDVAIIRLNEEVARDLEVQYKFLEPNLLDIQHQVVASPQYLLAGFPVSKTKIKPGASRIKPQPFIFQTKEASEKFYQKLGIEAHSNIILEYRKSKIKNFTTQMFGQGPDPYGVSGSGLWFLPSFVQIESDIMPYRLVGIMIEWRQSQNIVIATRIHIVTEIIRKEFGMHLPHSNFTYVNIENNPSSGKKFLE